MDDEPDSLAAAWRAASDDLGIEVATPFNPDDSHPPLAGIVWVKDFGTARGTVVAGRHTAPEDIRASAAARSMYYSEIDEAAYRRYDRDLFVATLNDWGWHGNPDAAPEWYTGEPWA